MALKGTGKPELHGFLVTVELEEGGHATPGVVVGRLADGLSYMDGVGEVEVEHLGTAKEEAGIVQES